MVKTKSEETKTEALKFSCLDIRALLNSGLSITNIQNWTKLTAKQLEDAANGIVPIASEWAKYPVANENYFGTPKYDYTMAHAYWLGVIMSRGTYNRCTKVFSIKLHKSHTEFLQELAKVLGAASPVVPTGKTKNKYVELNIANAKFAQSLELLGFTSENNVEVPSDVIPQQYKPFFLKGCMDVSGTINSCEPHKAIRFEMVGYSNFLISLQRFLMHELKLPSVPISSVSKRWPEWSSFTYTNSKDVMKVVDYIYSMEGPGRVDKQQTILRSIIKFSKKEGPEVIVQPSVVIPTNRLEFSDIAIANV